MEYKKKKPYITRLQDQLREAEQKLEREKLTGNDPYFDEVIKKWSQYKSENQDRSLVHFLDWCSDHE